MKTKVQLGFKFFVGGVSAVTEAASEFVFRRHLSGFPLLLSVVGR